MRFLKLSTIKKYQVRVEKISKIKQYQGKVINHEGTSLSACVLQVFFRLNAQIDENREMFSTVSTKRRENLVENLMLK